MPVINIANPIKIVPISFFFSFLENIIRITPITAKTGENEDGFNNWIKKLSLSIPDKLKIQDVIVVPTFAPIMIPMDCDNFIIPELTNPTTITVVAEEDWMTAVTPAPNKTALIGLEVNFSSIFSSLPPDTFSNPFPMVFIPNRNSANPPIIVNTPKISMPLHSLFSFLIK